MSIAARIIESLALAAAAPLPRVRALHLPPSPWNQHRDGEFGAIELEDGSVGLSYVLLNDALAQLTQNPQGGLVGADPLTVARWWLDPRDVRSTVGFAAVNAISRHLFDRNGFVPPAASDSIADLDPQPGDHIGMVGYFPPLLKRIAATGAQLTILELKTELVGTRDGYTVTTDPADLRSCNKVMTTSTTLLNHTFDALMPWFAQANKVALIGPGAGCLPDALFASGISTIGGTWITDAPGFINALRAGEPWGGRFARKFTLHRRDYPGLSA